MAGLAASDRSKSKRGHSQPPKNLARRVSFNESILTQSQDGDIEAQKAKAKEKRFCNRCCACASLIIGTLVLMVLMVGIIFFVFFQSNLPYIHVQSLNVHKLEVNSTGQDFYLDADIEVVLNSTNKNDKMGFYFSPMRADVSSGDIYLGKVHVGELAQKPHNSTQLKVRTVLAKMPIDESDGKQLKQDALYHHMIISVDLKGEIHYNINGNRMTGFPFKVLCHDIAEDAIDAGQAPECIVKMTPVS